MVKTMKYLSVSEIAAKWNISERSARNYCAQGRIPGAVLNGKVWFIPENARKPARKIRSDSSHNTLLDRLRIELDGNISGGIYHRIQIDLTYNSNHIEGSRLSHEQTKFIFETNTIGIENSTVSVDDIVETANHFHCIDVIIREAKRPLSESFALILRCSPSLYTRTASGLRLV